MAKSYFAKYWSTNNVPLLGGVRSSQSCRYQRRGDAELRLEIVKEVNGDRCVGEIVESDLFPEIFIHCGVGPSQAVGCKCFRCHKTLTAEDAKRAVGLLSNDSEY